MALGSEEFPLQDIEASASDRTLQEEHPFAEVKPEGRQLMEARLQEALRAGASADTAWIYFSSPAWTWKALCGRAGWLLYDPQARRQLDFMLELMN